MSNSSNSSVQQYGRCPTATSNSEIGDIFLYKTALSDAERKQLVNFVAP